MKKTIISLLVAGAAIVANAQDKALLETLVKKGMLTQQEAAQIAKESVAVTPASKSTKSIKIFGGAQGWYSWSDTSVKAGNIAGNGQNSGFTLRYVKLGVEADVGGGWTATVVTDFGTEGESKNYLDKVVASKKIDLDYINGTLQLGLRKVNMGYEQNMCDFGQLAVERSVATYFFTRNANKNFGSRTVGAFWDGNITQVDGLYYSLAVTSGVSEGGVDNFITDAENSSALSFWASMGYKNVAEVNGESLAYDFGLNFGYAPQGAVVPRVAPLNSIRGSVWGINPYATLNWRGFTVIAEYFLQQVEDYRAPAAGGRNGGVRTPMGGNLTVAYKMDIGEWGAIEPVIRGSFVDANGLPLIDGFGADRQISNFDQYMTLYAGVNWYPTSAIKTSLAYEFGYYDQGADVQRVYGNTIWAQVQVLF